MPRLVVWMMFIVVATIPLASNAGAQSVPSADAGVTPPSAPTDAALTPPISVTPAPSPDGDIVVLRAGGWIRGTIVELIPSVHVVIRTLAGETRTIPMAEVEYAGRELDRPGTATDDATEDGERDEAEEEGDEDEEDHERVYPDVVIHAPRVRLTLRSRGRELTFYLTDASGESTAAIDGMLIVSRGTGLRRLCTTPCAVTLAAGRYRFALGRGRARPRALERSFRFAGDAELTGHFDDRTAARRMGGIVAVASLVVGGVLFVALAEADEVVLGAALGGGIVLIGGGVGLGLYAAREQPHIHVER